jgi:hypothetical protein
MPHLEEQFPPVNPLVLQRPDALDPPDREEEEEARPIENRIEDEIPLPGSLADGIDRVTISANARAIVPVQPQDETVPLPPDLIPGESEVNPEVPELLNSEAERREVGADAPESDEAIGTSLQDLVNGLAERRREEASSTRTGLNPIEPRTVPIPPPARAPEAPPAIEAELELEEATELRNEIPFAPVTPPPRSTFSVAPDDGIILEPVVEDAPETNTVGLRGDTPVPRTEGRVNIIPPAIGNEETPIAEETVDAELEERAAIPGPDTAEEAPPELLIASAVQPGFVAEPEPFEETEPAPNLSIDDTPEPALADPADIPGPAGAEVAVSSLIDTRQVLEEDQETQALQAPALPELDPDEPFVPILEPEAPARNIPFVVQGPLNVLPPSVENVVAVAPAVPGSVAALDENSQALRRDTLGSDPALRSNRELRNFLQEFNDRIDPPEQVTELDGGPITEVQNNTPPPPAAFENLEAASAELLENLREQEAREGVTRPEEERTAPPEPRTPESILTGRGQNIDRFI